MDAPLVSIIIPVYNSAGYLTETIRSAMAQTWANKEIIIVDDGSTDNSLAIAREFENDNIKVFSQPNSGASAARNRGLAEAKGEYIQFLDADDLLSVDKIEVQVKALTSNQQKVAVCSTIHFFDGQQHAAFRPSNYEESFLFDDNDPVHFLINLWGGYSTNGSMVTIHAWLTPIAVIKKAGPWNESLSVDDDGEFFCRVLLNSTGVIRTAGYSYYRKYKNNSKSLSAGKTQKHYLSQFESLKMRYNAISLYKQSEALKLAYGKSLMDFKNRIYPASPQLRREISHTIKGLNIVLPKSIALKQMIKKYVRYLLGHRISENIKKIVVK